MELRPYQEEAINRVRSAMREGYRRIILASCTGSGKTVVMAKIASEAVARGKKVLIVVDDSPLIDQTIDKLKQFGVLTGVIKAGYNEDPEKVCQVASIDTLIRRSYPEASLILIDECHLSYAKKYAKLFETYSDKFFIGFSATPERTKKKEKLGDIWEIMIQSLTIDEAINIGANVPPIVYTIKRHGLNLEEITLTAGDYNNKQLADKMSSPIVINTAVQTWINKAEGRPTIAFCVNVEHSRILCEAFNAAGIAADRLDGKTSDDARDAIYSALRTGKIKVLVSVNVLTIGFDEPSVSCILCCRPIKKSKVMWIQMIGRGLRLFKGKYDCLVLDQAENVYSHGHPQDYEPAELTDSNNDEKAKATGGMARFKVCDSCGQVVPAATRICECGHKFPLNLSDPLTEGEEKLVTPLRKLPVDERKRAIYSKLITKAFKNNYKPGWAYHRYVTEVNENPTREIKLHAIFGKSSTAQNKAEYLKYLTLHAKNSNKDESWIITRMREEFGKNY